MFSVNDRISVRQVQALFLLEIFGTSILILPRTTAEFAGQDGWLVIIIATAIAALCMFVLASAGRIFPSDTFVDSAAKILTRPIAIIIAVGFLFRLIVVSAMELRVFGEIIKLTMLRDTPYSAVCAAMVSVGGYAAMKGCETRARLAQILVVLAFIPLLAVFLIGAADVDFTNLMPVLVNPPSDILRGGLHSLRAFSGIEFILLLYPFINQHKRVRRGAVQIVLVIGGLMLFITVVTIAKFGPFDIKDQMWPTLQMMDATTIPGAFIERQDALIMSFWIISVFAITGAGLFFSAVLLKGMFKKFNSSYCIMVSGAIVFILSFLPENVPQVYLIMELVLAFGFIYMLAVPLLMLSVAKLRRLGGNI